MLAKLFNMTPPTVSDASFTPVTAPVIEPELPRIQFCVLLASMPSPDGVLMVVPAGALNVVEPGGPSV